MIQRRPVLVTLMLIVITTSATAGLGAIISGGANDPWYAALVKPALTPPDMVFAIVWPILFTLMTLGVVLVRITAGSFNAASSALGLYFTQLAMILAWVWLFFGFHQSALAMVALIALWLLVTAMMRSFAQHSVAAAILQIPYILWLTFEAYLNGAILGLN